MSKRSPTSADYSVLQAAELMASGRLRSRELVQACLDRIEDVDGEVEAWTHLDPDYALAQADEADAARESGDAPGPLHGVPVGVKDIFDTRDMPTENGSVLHAGRTPNEDATAVARLRAAGAVIMGKTVTTEFAAYAPGKTRNPHDPTRTPGGSSSGSAAAVAAGMVPLAIGSQTNGSTIRPASFCGACGFKPSHGLISRHRMLALSRALDHVGLFARSVDDVAVLADALEGHDGLDPDVAARSRGSLWQVAVQAPAAGPRLAFAHTPVWDRADDATKEAFAELIEFLGDRVETRDLPEPFDDALALHEVVLETDLAVNLAAEYESGRDRISPRMRGMIERGREHKAVDYLRAIETAGVLNRLLDEIFDGVDAIVTPAANGEAPVGLEATGDPAFCTIWSLLGTPAISLPLMQGENGLPLGVQLVGRRGDDGRLLRTARWLSDAVDATE